MQWKGIRTKWDRELVFRHRVEKEFIRYNLTVKTILLKKEGLNLVKVFNNPSKLLRILIFNMA